MPGIISTAPGKTILFGEHAVVYGKPAIAVPVTARNAKVKVFPNIIAPSETINFIAPQIDLNDEYLNLPQNHPLKIAVNEVKKFLKLEKFPSCKIFLETTIPISSGLGSSAAISVALIKGLLDFVGFTSTAQIVSDLAFQVEIEFHGNPSGIDNTVIAFNKPILYQKGAPLKFISPGAEFSILIADSGVKGNTKTAVSGVRERWESNPATFNQYFDEIEEVVLSAKKMLETGNHRILGDLMNKNQRLLFRLGVSHESIEVLVDAAINAGALGAKLCGGGLGGNIVVLVEEDNIPEMTETLFSAGAADVISMKLIPGEIE